MAIKCEGIGDLSLEPFQPKHIAFPSRSFGKSAPVNRSFQVTIWVLMAPDSISEHANFLARLSPYPNQLHVSNLCVCAGP